jgi:hypothetical protein
LQGLFLEICQSIAIAVRQIACYHHSPVPITTIMLLLSHIIYIDKGNNLK